MLDEVAVSMDDTLRLLWSLAEERSQRTIELTAYYFRRVFVCRKVRCIIASFNESGEVDYVDGLDSWNRDRNQSLPPAEAERILIRTLSNVGDLETKAGLRVCEADLSEGPALVLASAEGTFFVIALALNGTASTQARVSSATSYIKGLRPLLSCCRTLFKNERSREMIENAAWEEKVRSIENSRSRIEERLEDMEKLILSRPHSVDARQSLIRTARWASTEFRAGDWDEASDDHASRASAIISLFEKLRVCSDSLELESIDAQEITIHRSIAIPDSLRSEEVLRAVSVVATPQAHLALWSYLHRRSRLLEDTPDLESLWSYGLQEGLQSTDRLLSQIWSDEGVGRSYIGLWCAVYSTVSFGRRILSSQPHRGGASAVESAFLPQEKMRLCRDFAFVLQEGYRAYLYQDNLSYSYDSRAFVRALVSLVAAEAEVRYELPRSLSLRRLLLSLLEGKSPEDEFFCASHLQHSLQIYFLGSFLLDLVDSRSGVEGWRLSEVLASKTDLKPGPRAEKQLRLSWLLSALFHDVGMLVVPRVVPGKVALSKGDEQLRQEISRISDTGSMATEIMTRVARELQDNDYYHPADEHGLARWFQSETKAGRLDHSAIGAWYLHRVLVDLEGISKEVRFQAVRAVLLHQVPVQTIDAQRDPAAALLSLGDELFDWLPSSRRPGDRLSAYSTSRNILDVRPEGSRSYRIRFPAIVRDGADWIFKPKTGQASLAVEAYLKDIDSLRRPVYLEWLAAAQNMVRIIPWNERFEIRICFFSKRPRPFSDSSFTVLERWTEVSTLPFAARVAELLRRHSNLPASGSRIQGDARVEHFEVVSRGEVLWPRGDISAHFAPLDAEILEVVRQERVG